jgi:predicted metal-dependent hydrolase
MVHARLTHWNQFYGHSFGRVAIRNQRSRWGSCSSKRNLNFNYRIVFLPEHLVDYIIVHELCHLEHFNHSKNFWDAMARTMPDFHIRKQELFTIPLHQIAHESLTGAN